MEYCYVCLGNGKRLGGECPLCNGLGFIGKISREGLVDFISHEAEKAGFNIFLQDSEKTSVNGIECSAFFDPNLKVLAVARQNDNFFENLIHEFCHLRQYKIGCDAWNDSFVEGIDSSDILDGFLNNQITLSDDNLQKLITRIIEMEWDCESRVKEYLVNVEGYSQESLNIYDMNAFMYMRFYRAVQYFKKWHLPNKDFLAMRIHQSYVDEVVNKYGRMPKYNDALLPEEINLFRRCFE